MSAVSEGVVAAPPVVKNAERKMSFPVNKEKNKTRRRRSSSLMYQEPPESLEQQSDQAILPNLNAQWVNAKGMSQLLSVDGSTTASEVVHKAGIRPN